MSLPWAFTRGQLGNAPGQGTGKYLNDYRDAGFYYFGATSAPLNWPIATTGTAGVLHVISSAVASGLVQIVYRISASNTSATTAVFSRTYATPSGATEAIWTEWRRSDTYPLEQNVTGLTEDVELLINDVAAIRDSIQDFDIELPVGSQTQAGILRLATDQELQAGNVSQPPTAGQVASLYTRTATVEGAVSSQGSRVSTLETATSSNSALIAGHETRITSLEAGGGSGTVDLSSVVPITRTISTTAPLTGGGALSANRTLAISTATTSATGAIQLATQAEVTAGTVTNKAVAPSTLAGASVPLTRTVSTTAPLTGGGALSSNLTLAVSAASTSAAGVAQLSTTTEATTGTDTTKIVTPAGLAAHVSSKTSSLATTTALNTTNTNVTNLTTRVTTAEGNITSQGNRITNLELGGGGGTGGGVTIAPLGGLVNSPLGLAVNNLPYNELPDNPSYLDSIALAGIYRGGATLIINPTYLWGTITLVLSSIATMFPTTDNEGRPLPGTVGVPFAFTWENEYGDVKWVPTVTQDEFKSTIGDISTALAAILRA